MESITLTAPDISCEHCQRAIETAVSEMNGVARVAVDITARSVAVDYDHRRLTAMRSSSDSIKRDIR